MSFDPSDLLDPTDWRLLESLQENARSSFAELGRQVGLSPPAAAERVRRLEDRGVITGYHAAINPARLGFGLGVFLRASVPPKDYPRFTKLVTDRPEVLECHHVTGGESFVLRATVRSVEGLESLIKRLSLYGQTATALVLSTPLARRIFRRGDGSPAG